MSLNCISNSNCQKPWSSGRVLTDAQRIEKRRKDRQKKKEQRSREREEIDELKRKLILLQSHCQCALPARKLGPQDEEPLQTSLYSLSADRHYQHSDYLMLGWSNRLLGAVHGLEKTLVSLDDSANQDALIRAVLYGWETLQTTSSRFYCPLWTILGQIDTTFFVHCTILTRFCMLRMIHLLLLCFVDLDNVYRLPAWYRPRPTQVLVGQDITADYFAWPGFRERLAVTSSYLLTDTFFALFASGFYFAWNGTVSDIYAISPSTGLYHFSPIFKASLHDIRHWTMSDEFFLAFPEIRDDFKMTA